MSTAANEPPWLTAWKNGGQAAQPAEPGRTPAGTFAPGVSGNAAGMVKGTKHTRTKLAEALKENGAALLQTAMTKALLGDSSMLHLCLSRLVPTVKPKSEPTPFALDATQPRHVQAQQIVAAVATGDLDSDTARVLLDCLTAAAGLEKLDLYESQMKAIQDQLAAMNKAQGARGGVVEVPMTGEDLPGAPIYPYHED